MINLVRKKLRQCNTECEIDNIDWGPSQETFLRRGSNRAEAERREPQPHEQVRRC